MSVFEKAAKLWSAVEARKVGSTTLTSLLSKVLAAIMQAMSVPVAMATIGPRSFGAFLILSSVAFWITSTSIGIASTLTNEMAAGRDEQTSPVPAVGVALGIFQAVIISAGCYIFILFSLPSMLGTSDPAILHEAQLSGALLVGAAGIQLAVQPLQGMQLGMLQGYISFAFQAAANLSVIIGLVCLKWLPHPSLLAFCFVIAAIPLVAIVANVFLFLRSTRSKFRWPLKAEIIPLTKRLYGSGVSFLMINLATYAVLYGPTVFLAWMTGGQKFLEFSIYNRVVFFLIYFVWLLALPLWPAIVHARADGDERWVRRAVHTCFVLFSVVACILFVVVALFGRQLINLWVGADVGQTASFSFVFAVYYILVIWREFLITVLISFERVRVVALVQVGQTVLAYGLAFLLVPVMGQFGMVVAMTVGIAVTSAWILPMIRIASSGGAEHSVANLFVTGKSPQLPTTPA